LSSELDRGEEDGGESTYNRITNNKTGNSDGRVSTSTDAILIHAICECNKARYMNPVKPQVQNFIIFGVDNANAVVIPYGHDANGVPIVDPAVLQPTVILPVSTTSPAPGGTPSNAPTSGTAQDPNAALVQGVLVAIQAMTQLHVQSDLRKGKHDSAASATSSGYDAIQRPATRTSDQPLRQSRS